MVVVCPDCGRPVRYITPARGKDIFMVDVKPETLIAESGRVLTGFRVHKCPDVAAAAMKPGETDER